MTRVLEAGYFHVVFTLPAELRCLARRFPREIHDLLFQAGSETLLTLGREPKRMGGLAEICALTHTSIAS